jgi:hypothetical protein
MLLLGFGRVVVMISTKSFSDYWSTIDLILELCCKWKIPLWLNIHVSCVMLQPRRPETTCSSNDPLHYIVGNIYSHIGIHWLLVHMLICNKFSRVLRCKLHSFSLWRSLCLYYRHCGHPEMILSSKGLLPFCTVAGENSRMSWLSLFIKLNSNLILVSKIGWTTLYSYRFSLQACSLFLFFLARC